MRLTGQFAKFLLVLWCLSVAAAEFDLLNVERLKPKGRVQDNATDSTVLAVLEMNSDAIPYLIERLSSERLSQNRPLDYWPVVVEGDLALAILSDLFLDPTWRKSTLPELCWDSLLGRSGPETPAWELLEDFVAENGREEIEVRWRATYLEHRDKIVWDESGQFFRVSGKELQACQ